jgi:hypothetical protein
MAFAFAFLSSNSIALSGGVAYAPLGDPLLSVCGRPSHGNTLNFSVQVGASVIDEG